MMCNNEAQSEDWVHFTISHEMGHQIAGHGFGEFKTSVVPANKVMKREGDLIALAMLIPTRMRDATRRAEDVVRKCEVPLEHMRRLRADLTL